MRPRARPARPAAAADQHGDDRDDDEQLDQGKSPTNPNNDSPHRRRTMERDRVERNPEKPEIKTETPNDDRPRRCRRKWHTVTHFFEAPVLSPRTAAEPDALGVFIIALRRGRRLLGRPLGGLRTGPEAAWSLLASLSLSAPSRSSPGGTPHRQADSTNQRLTGNNLLSENRDGSEKPCEWRSAALDEVIDQPGCRTVRHLR